MYLQHCRRQSSFETSEQVTELVEAITVRMNGPVFFPQDRQRHAGLLQLDRDCAQVRLNTPSQSLLAALT